jgi:DNA-binding phage protein
MADRTIDLETIRIIEAEENLLIDFQFLVQEAITAKGISRSELAEKAGMSKARLSQVLTPEANPTVKTMARIFHALGLTLSLYAKSDVRALSVPGN